MGSMKQIGSTMAALRRTLVAALLISLGVTTIGPVQAQSSAPPVPITISPLRVENDPNGVNLATGKTQIPVPSLSVPAAPNLRFDMVQNSAPYVRGEQWGSAGDYPQASFSAHTLQGSSEAFTCIDWDCRSVTGTGSVFDPGTRMFMRAGSGEIYRFNSRHVEIGGVKPTSTYYATRVEYPDGEVITIDYDRVSRWSSGFERVFHRPVRITSSTGYFITVTYHSNDLNSGAPWSSPAQAALYSNASPWAPLQRLTYSLYGTIITDLGGRTYQCSSCINTLGNNLETANGEVRLHGESGIARQFISHPTATVVSTVLRDGVQWNYSYANLYFSNSEWRYSRVVVTGPGGYSTAYDIAYDGKQNSVSRVTDSLGRTTNIERDGAYRPIRIVSPEGDISRVVYGIRGNIIASSRVPKPGSGLSEVIERAEYPTTEFGCDNFDFDPRCYRPKSHRDALGRQTDFAYNERGQLVERTDPADADGVRRKTYITYTLIGGISRPTVVRVCGDITTCGTVHESRIEYQYWGSTGLPSVVTQVDAARGERLETRYAYDAAGRVLSVDGPLPGSGDTSYKRYDIFGRVTWEIGPADSAGNRSTKHFAYRDADDKIVLAYEGSIANPDTYSLSVMRYTTFDYDTRRNPVRESAYSSGVLYAVTQRSFTDRGQLECEARRMNPAAFSALPWSACSLGAAGAFGGDRVSRNIYDAAGQLLRVQRAVGTALQQDYATYTYTLNGKRQTVRDANGNLTTYEYDGLDRLSRTRFPSPTIGSGASSWTDFEQYSYDPVGNRISLRKRDGTTITYAYDALNRVRTKSVPASATGAAGYSVHYGYDFRGLQLYARFGSSSGAGVSNTYDGFGRLRTSTSNMDGVNRTVSTDHFTLESRVRLTHPDGNRFEYSYDTASRLMYVGENGLSQTLASVFHDGFGRRIQLSRDISGARTILAYNGAWLGSLSQDMDGAGTGRDLTIGFAYNPASQIVTRAQSNDLYESPVTAASRSYTVNGLNQYTQVSGDGAAALSHDANGNLTSDGSTAYVYDAENRLVRASGATNATLSYDPMGRLWQVSGGAGTTRFMYDGDRLIAEYNGAGTLLRRYVHGPGVDEPLVWYEGAGVGAGSRRYLHADHQGSVIAVSDASGAVLGVNRYDPYGVPAASNLGRFGYTGQTRIGELGLYYYKARIYNPWLGRFMQTDPIGYEDDLNLYAYVGGDPVNRTDPTGQSCVQTSGSATGSRIERYDCMIDRAKFDDKIVERKDMTAEQKASLRDAEKALTATVNNLANKPGRTAVTGEDGKTRTHNAQQVAGRLARATVVYDPKHGGASKWVMTTDWVKQTITLGRNALSAPPDTPDMPRGIGDAMRWQTAWAHEGLHLVDYTGWRRFGATFEEANINHQRPYNSAAFELLRP